MSRRAGISPTTSSSQSARRRPRVGDLADDGAVELPPVADGEDRVEHLAGGRRRPSAPGSREIITSHGSIPSSRSGTRSRRRSIPQSRAISESDEASPAAPQSCSDSTRPDSTSSTETSISRLPVNGSPTWTLGRLSASSSPSSWLASTEAPPIPSRPGGRAVEDDEVARAGRCGPRDAVGGQEPDAHRVHEHVVAVGVVEDRLAADRRHADRVPVGADPGDGAVEARVAVGEAEPVEQRDRPRAHRDDVAQDPADAGRSALEGLDRRRVVVALDLEADCLAVAEIEDARVLTGALQDAFPRGGKPFQQEGRVLVAAVLRPEEREDRQLEVVRLAPEQLDDARQLPVGEDQGRGAAAVPRPATGESV